MHVKSFKLFETFISLYRGAIMQFQAIWNFYIFIPRRYSPLYIDARGLTWK